MLSTIQQILTGASLASVLTYVYKEEIRTMSSYLLSELTKYIYDKLYVRLILPREEHRCNFALGEEISKLTQTAYVVKDGNTAPLYAIAEGRYSTTCCEQNITIVIHKDYTELYSFMGDMAILQKYMHNVFNTFCSPDKQMMYYSIENLKWKYPIFRKPVGDVVLKNPTNSMTVALNYIDTFTKSESKYISNGQHYKLGLFIVGGPGTGKTTIVEIVATKYNMPVYILNLNVDGMNDTILLNLVCSVPSRSIIICDEFEKQLAAINNNDTVTITHGGILNAIDGVPRLANGVIFVAIGNSANDIDQTLLNLLLRPGRIDMKFTFEESFIKN